MAVAVRPIGGGFPRPFGTAWFIVEFLKGNIPEGSKQIDPDIGAPMTDIHFEYKSALHRAHASDAAEREEERRIKRGLGAFIEEEYRQRLAYYLDRTSYKELKMRYASFTRYFGHLKRLGWVEETGKTEPSAIQEDYPPAPPRVFYRLTEASKKATLVKISNPIKTLYPKFNEEYYREKRQGRRYYTKKK